MKKIICITVFFLFSFVCFSFAEISLKAEVDKIRLTIDEDLTYKIVVTSSDKIVLNLEKPNFFGFRVLSQAQSTTTSLIKGSPKTILVYAFVLVPTNIGKFKIGPATVKIKDKIYSTDIFEIEVKPGKSKPKQKSLPPEESPSKSEEPQITL